MEKRKMYNAYADLEGYNCFGCSPTNPYGLKCKFVDEGEYITCHWVPSENYQGFFHVLHGGIQTTLIDEIASWAIFSHEKTAGVTTEMQVKYRRPVRTDQGEGHGRVDVGAGHAAEHEHREHDAETVAHGDVQPSGVVALRVLEFDVGDRG